jgi:rSAM/selenodomain-associated transferase 2
MKLSVIIPALNESAHIALAVRHALLLEPVEVIVADGGSDDGTQRIARTAGARLIDVPRGRARQQNAGAAAACGDTFLFLHADCWLEERARQQIEQWSLAKRIVAATFQQRIEASGFVYRLLETGNALRVCTTRLAFGDQGLVIRRNMFEKLGRFPEVALMEDVLFMRKVRELGRLQLLPGPLHVNARRWQKHGPIRQTLRNFFLLTAEQLGVSPDSLSRLYLPHWIKHKRSVTSQTETR